MMIRAAVLSAFFVSSASAQLTAGVGVPAWVCPIGKNAAECADLFMTECKAGGSTNSGCTSGLCSKPPGCYTGTENECYVRPNYGFPDDAPTDTPTQAPCTSGTYGDAAGTGMALNADDYPTHGNFYGAVPTFTNAICPQGSTMCMKNNAGLIPIGSSMGSFSCSWEGLLISITLNPNSASSFTATTPSDYSIMMMVGTTTAGTASYGYFILLDADGSPTFGSSNKVSLSVMDIGEDDGSFNGVYVCLEHMEESCRHNEGGTVPGELLPYLADYKSPTKAPVITSTPTKAPVKTARPSKAPTSRSPTKAPQAAAANEAVLPTKSPQAAAAGGEGQLPGSTPVICADAIGGFATPSQDAWKQGVTGDAYNKVGAGQGGMRSAPDCPMTANGYSLRCVTQEIDGSSTNYGVEFWVPGGNVLTKPGDTSMFMCQVTGCNPQDMTGIMIPVLVTNENGVAFTFDVQSPDYVITMLNMKAGVNANMVSFPICDGGDCTDSTVASSTSVSGRSSVTASPPYLNGKFQGLSHVNLCIAPVCAICGPGCAAGTGWPTCTQSASSNFAATTTATTVAAAAAITTKTTTGATAKPKGNSGK